MKIEMVPVGYHERLAFGTKLWADQMAFECMLVDKPAADVEQISIKMSGDGGISTSTNACY